MVLLKAEEFSLTDQKKEIFNLCDIAEEARQIILSARCESRRILDRAQAEIEKQRRKVLEQSRQEGYQKGHQEGHDAGCRQALEEARQSYAQNSAESLALLHNIFQNFEQAKDQIFWRAEQETVVLALALVEKIIGQIVPQSGRSAEIASQNLKKALELISRNTDVTVKMNPDDLAYLEKMAGKNETLFGQLKHLTLEPDQTIPPGGSVVLTDQGKIDSQIDTLTRRLAEELILNDPAESD